MSAQAGIRAWLAPRARVRLMRLVSRIDASMGEDSIGLRLWELSATIEEHGRRVDRLAARTDQLAYEAKMERRATDEGLSAVLERLRLLEANGREPVQEPAGPSLQGE